MAAPEPFDPPPGRFGVPGRRGVVPRGRATLRTFVVEPVESPLRRLLRTTAAQIELPVDSAPPAAAPPARWRRPERHPELPEPPADVVVEDASGPDRVELAFVAPAVLAPEVLTPETDAATAIDEDLPPILRAMLAQRATAEAAVPEATAGVVPDTGSTEAVSEIASVHDSAEESRAEFARLEASPEVAAALPEVSAALPEVSDTVLTAHRTPEPDSPSAFVPPVVFDPPAAPPAVDGIAALTASLPSVRLAAVACPEGETEPPLCHPAAAVISRARPLSPLRAIVRHGRRVRRLPFVAGVAAASVLVATLATAATAAWAMTPAPVAEATEAATSLSVTVAQDPPPIASLDQPAEAVVAAVATCDIPAVQTALAAGDPTGLIAATGGAQAFHDAIVTGAAPCLSLGDSAWPWVVVNKQRPNSPVDYSPPSVVLPDGVSSAVDGGLRPDAAAALSALVAASRDAGVGDIRIESAYRSYDTQTATHDEQVASSGAEAADATSARAGYSEHQTGLAADLVACDGGCGSMDDFGASPQGQWVAANAWQYGWIVRYESGTTAVTGYDPEPWHLRYIGPELAALYHAAGFHTLEEFWNLPAAPTY